MKYFIGSAEDLGNVSAAPFKTFSELCDWINANTRTIVYTQDEFLALEKKDRDQIKRAPYVTAAAFAESPSRRRKEHAIRCNLIALDIDDSEEATRLLSQRWDEILPELAYIVWHTANSTPKAPRLRVLVAADAIAPDRYPDAVRTVAEMIGLTNITRESCVAAQPMYLPIVFDNPVEEISPIVICNPNGEALTSSEVIGDDESSLPSTTIDQDQAVDLRFLRDKMDGVTLEIAEQALAVCDPDCSMQQWIEIGMGLKHQFGDEAFGIWDAWSAKGDKYMDSQETQYRWSTIREQPNRAPVTIRSLFKVAASRGWSNAALGKRHYEEVLHWLREPSRSTEELMDQGPVRIAKISHTIAAMERKVLVNTLSSIFKFRQQPLSAREILQTVVRIEREELQSKGLPPWAKNLVFVTGLNVFYRTTSERRFSPEVIDLLHSTPTIGDEKPPRPRDYLVQLAGIPQVENLRYNPAEKKRLFSEDGVPYVNTYRPTYPAPDHDNKAIAGEIFRTHIANLIIEPEYQRTLIDFLAYMVQKPGRKIRWAVLIQGAQGCGKTAIAVAMTAVLGRRNVAKLAPSNVMEPTHNGWAYGHQLVVLEEVRIVGSNRHAVMDKLKPCISDDDISIREMRESPRTVPNVSNYLMFTNHHDSLAVREDDRRYFVLESRLQTPTDIAKLGGSQYFDTLFNMIRDMPGALRAWLEEWTISGDFNPEGRAPITWYLKELADSSASPLTAAVMNALEDEGHALVRRDLISVPALRNIIASSHNVKDFSDQSLASVLRELGYTKHGRMMIGGEIHTFYHKDLARGVRETAAERMELL